MLWMSEMIFVSVTDVCVHHCSVSSPNNVHWCASERTLETPDSVSSWYMIWSVAASWCSFWSGLLCLWWRYLEQPLIKKNIVIANNYLCASTYYYCYSNMYKISVILCRFFVKIWGRAVTKLLECKILQQWSASVMQFWIYVIIKQCDKLKWYNYKLE